jgi:phosphatidylserine/phosphatidylglycerophosphate/cardiolipin synthase-like enzyme
MRVVKHIVLVVVTLFSCFSVNSQISSKEKDYTIVYNDKSIELQFDMPVQLNAINENNKSEVLFEVASEKVNTFILNNPEPSSIIKLEYNYINGKSLSNQTSYIATSSLSTGTINVYFNHPVNTAFSQGQNAVNLGNTLDDMLISYIDACSSTLDIAIYNSSSPSSTTGIAGAINAAYTRGVQVRVVYDGSTTSGMIALLNTAIPKIASPDNSNYGIMHNKFVIFDANNSDANKPVVWTGSTNWTVSQIDGPDKNSCIVIQDQALALGYKIEFEEMWGSTTNVPNTSNSKFGPFKTDNTPHTYTIGGKIVNSYFSPSDGVTAKIIDAINTANSDIDVATMLITRSDISSALINKYSSGVSMTNLVMDTQNPSGNQKTALQAGISTAQVRTDTSSGVMHHKFMVVDNFNSSSDPLVLVGSHNWSSAAENKNDENTLIVHDLTIANQYYQAFAYLYQLSGGTLSSDGFNVGDDELTIYPNPSNGIFNLKSNNTAVNDVEVRVYSILGNRVYTKQFTTLINQTIDLTNQSSGIYMVIVSSSIGVSYFKVIKQ